MSLEIHFSSSLHDREVRLVQIIPKILFTSLSRFSNGWIVKIGRGLDYFQKPKVKSIYASE